MLKIVCLLFLILTAIVRGQERFPLTNTFKVINYVVEPNNKFLQQQRNGIVTWTKSVSRDGNGIKVYVQSLSVQQLLPAGNLCSPTFFHDYIRQLNAVLSNGRSCPIQEGTTINILREYTENSWQTPIICSSNEIFNFTLYDKMQKSKILSLEAELNSSGAACKNG